MKGGSGEAHISIIRRNRHDHEVSFLRMAQFEAELEALRAARAQAPTRRKRRET
jgi:hypothetical protein